jgi:hypothetical protein
VLIPSGDRLKKTYQKYAREIQATGAGIKETVSPAWDTDSEQGFIQAPTGLREGEKGREKTKQADIGP